MERCKRCGGILNKCFTCGNIFCPNCEGMNEGGLCPECESPDIGTLDLSDISSPDFDDYPPDPYEE